MTLLTSIGLRQSAAISIHHDCSGTLHRILNADVPDPFFLTPTQKKKKRSGYVRLVSNIVRPLQINSLFPIHHPHLVTIIPYSSIIFRLFLHTDRLSKSYLEKMSAHVSAVLSLRHRLHFCAILQLKKERRSLSLLLCSFLWLCQANNGLKSCQYYNGNEPPAHMQIWLSPGQETENLFGVA